MSIDPHTFGGDNKSVCCVTARHKRDLLILRPGEPYSLSACTKVFSGKQIPVGNF